MVGFDEPDFGAKKLTFATPADFERLARTNNLILIAIILASVLALFLLWRALRSPRGRHWLQHLLGMVAAIGGGFAAIAISEFSATGWIITGIAMVIRELAFTAVMLSPIGLVVMLYGNDDGRTPPVTLFRLIRRYAAIAALFGIMYVIAARAFPGPWLSSE